MRLFTWIFSSFLLFSTTAVATDFVVPEQNVVGVDDDYKPGDVIILTISELEKKPEFLTEVQYDWLVMENGTPKKVRVSKDKTEVFWGAGVQTTKFDVYLNRIFIYQVPETVELKDGTKKTFVKEVGIKKPPMLFKQIKIQGINPQPAPPPKPDNPDNPPAPPKPEPVFPSTKYGLTKFIFDEVKANVKLDTQSIVSNSKGMAGCFESQAAQLAAGGFKKPDGDYDFIKFIADTKTCNVNVCGSNYPKWDSPFGDHLSDKLYTMYKEQAVLRTKEDFVMAWNEIRDGFKVVAEYYSK